ADRLAADLGDAPADMERSHAAQHDIVVGLSRRNQSRGAKARSEQNHSHSILPSAEVLEASVLEAFLGAECGTGEQTRELQVCESNVRKTKRAAHRPPFVIQWDRTYWPAFTTSTRRFSPENGSATFRRSLPKPATRSWSGAIL